MEPYRPALVALLFVLLYPYPFTLLAKMSKRYNNREGRVYLENLTGWRRKMYWIHLNSLEAVPYFSTSLLTALLLKADPFLVNFLSLLFVFLRVLYSLMYLLDLSWARSIVWTSGYLLSLGLFLAGWW